MVSLVHVEVNDAELRRLEEGPVTEDLERRGEDVATMAQRRAPKRTGRLAGSVRARRAELAGLEDVGPAVDVVADAENRGFQYGVVVEFARPFLSPSLEEFDHG